MHYPCPNCNSFTCTNHIVNVSPPPWVRIQNPVPTPPGTDPLIAEIARLNVENYRLREENRSLKETLSKLQNNGIIDQLGRKLPLPDHHRECPHGQNGLAMCTCEELKVRDIRNAKAFDRAFDDLMDDDEGPKKCLHGNTECKRCDPTRAIKTPEGKPLLPTAEFSRVRIEDNKERGLSECNFQRQTGRTTAIVIEALEFVKSNRTSSVLIDADNHRMKKVIRDWLKHYADEMGVSHRDLARIIVKLSVEYVRGVDVGLRLRDNAFGDTKSVE